MPALGDVRIADPVVQNQVMGYFGPPKYIWSQVMPVVNISKRAAHVAAFGKELKRLHDTVVVPKQSKPYNDFNVGHRDVATSDRYAAYWLSAQEIEEWNIPMVTPEQFAAQRAYDEISRHLEAETAALVMNTLSWAAANQQAAGALWANIAYDIPAQIDTQASLVESIIGIDRSEMTLVVGGPVMPWIRRNTAVRAAANYVLGSTVAASAPIGVMTDQVIAEALGLKRLIVGREMIATDIAATTFYYPWDDDVALMYIPDSPSDMSAPVFGYNYRRDGHPKPYPPRQDYNRVGDPYIYEVEDCIAPNLLTTTTLVTTSEAGFVWFNAV